MSALLVPELDTDVDTLTAALAYAEAGWYVGPIRPDDTKHAGNVLGDDWPSKTARDPQTIISWFAGTGGLGVYLHAGRSGAWIADIDDPDQAPPALTEAITQLRPPFQSSRPDQPGRGHAVFAQPAGRQLGNSTGQLGKVWGEARGRNGIIVAAPTPRSDGGAYRWLRTGPVPTLPIAVADLLPDAGPGAGAVDDAALSAFLLTHARADRPSLLKAVTNAYKADVAAGGSRHGAARDATCWAMREAACGFYPAQDAAQALRDLYVADRIEDRAGGRAGVREDTARAEYRSIAAWAVAQVDLDDLEQRRRDVNGRAPDRLTQLPGNGPPADRSAPGGCDTAAGRLRRHLLAGRAVLDIPEPGHIIDKTIPAKALVVDYGPPKSAKSFVVLDQNLAVATGAPWAPTWDREWAGGHQTTPGTVVYVVGEGVGGLGRRVKAWLTHHQSDDPGDIHWLTRPVNLTDTGEVWTFLELVGPLSPVMVTFDTLARCSLGAEENSAKDMGKVVAGLDLIRDETGATVRVVHHAGKDLAKGMRGSTALLGAADAVFEITRDGRAVKWRCTDMKDAEPPRPIGFQMTDVDGSIALTAGDPAEDAASAPASYWTVRDALQAIDLGDGISSTVWLDSCDSSISKATFNRAKKWLVENGHVDRAGEGRATRFRPVVTAG